jgi:hypothetical protein
MYSDMADLGCIAGDNYKPNSPNVQYLIPA